MKNSFARVPDTDLRACSNDSTWCSMALSVILNDMMTTGLVPSDTVPGYIGYRWYGSNGTCQSSGYTVIAFYTVITFNGVFPHR